MSSKTRRSILTSALISALALATNAASASEVGHFMPGVANIRDYVVPSDPGVYGVLYNYYYSTDQLNDRDGKSIDSVVVGPATLTVDVDIDVYAISPVLIWVSDWKIAGARYAAYIAPSFANSSIGASLGIGTGRGTNADTSQFDVGDLFVQPLWLGWSLTNFDFALGYGFYAPTGRYDTKNVVLPIIGTIKTEKLDNIGLGFWTHQFQGSGSWYPWEDKRMAISTTLTYEVHDDKDGFDLKPGENLTLNWGISQYLPLASDQSLLLEVGVAGYNSWQVSDDTGNAASNPDVHDQVHAAGGQIGLTYVPWMLTANFQGFGEFAAKDRFEGISLGLNFAKKF